MTTSAPSTRASRVWRTTLLVLVVAIIVVHVAAGWHFSNRIVDEGFRPAADVTLGDPSETTLDVELVTYPSPLGDMEAWLVAGSRNEWIIHVHGKGAALTEAIPLAESLAEAGYHQLIISYRNDPGQPADPSGFYHYGQTEWEDLEAAIAFAAGEGADSVAVVGYSTGAAIAVSHHLKTISPMLEALVLDSPNIDMEATIDYAAEQESLPFGLPIPPTVTALAKTLAGLRTSTNWRQIDYVERIERLGVPTLVFHGTADLTVPLETSRMAAAGSALVDLVEVDGAGHVGSREVNPAGYDQRVLAFLATAWR